jgi:hypothetical protein
LFDGRNLGRSRIGKDTDSSKRQSRSASSPDPDDQTISLEEDDEPVRGDGLIGCLPSRKGRGGYTQVCVDVEVEMEVARDGDQKRIKVGG